MSKNWIEKNSTILFAVWDKVSTETLYLSRNERTRIKWYVKKVRKRIIVRGTEVTEEETFATLFNSLPRWTITSPHDNDETRLSSVMD